jgi:hypothetical protein
LKRFAQRRIQNCAPTVASVQRFGHREQTGPH